MTQAKPESILIVRMSAFGDIICALPVLRAVRASFPRARIGWVVDSRFEALLDQDPDIDELFVAPISRWKKAARSPLGWPSVVAQFTGLRRDLRRAAYEVCLDLQGIVKSALVVRMAACERNYEMAGGRIAEKRWLVAGERVPCDNPHAVTRMLPLAGAIGAAIGVPRFDLHIPQADRHYAAELLREHSFTGKGPVVALNPGAAAPHRMWPADRFAQAARRIKQQADARIVVLGGPSEVELAQRITAQADIDALCTAGKTSLLQLAALIDHCRVVVTGDTGPQHVAAALGKRVVALFGPANPDRTGPFGDGHIVIRKPFDCQPCYAHPTCTDYDCMRAIQVDEVVEAVLRLTAPES